MGTVRVPSDVTTKFEGPVVMTNTKPAYARSDLALDSNKIYALDMSLWRVWNDSDAVLPDPSAADDLGYITGTFGTDAPYVETRDMDSLGATTLYGRFSVQLPAEYEAGESVTLRFSCGMITNVADNSCTIDIEAYKADREGGIGADICATAATSINSLTFADVDFTITPTTLSAGDWLDVRVAIATNDAATGAEVKARIGSAELLCDVKG